MCKGLHKQGSTLRQWYLQPCLRVQGFQSGGVAGGIVMRAGILCFGYRALMGEPASSEAQGWQRPPNAKASSHANSGGGNGSYISCA